MLAGVCGGIGEYFNIDPILVRLVFIFTGIGLVAYVVCAIVVPEQPV